MWLALLAAVRGGSSITPHGACFHSKLFPKVTPATVSKVDGGIAITPTTLSDLFSPKFNSSEKMSQNSIDNQSSFPAKRAVQPLQSHFSIRSHFHRWNPLSRCYTVASLLHCLRGELVERKCSGQNFFSCCPAKATRLICEQRLSSPL